MESKKPQVRYKCSKNRQFHVFPAIQRVHAADGEKNCKKGAFYTWPMNGESGRTKNLELTRAQKEKSVEGSKNLTY